MIGIVLWKPLYYISIAMFILSLLLLPFSPKWSVITVLALVVLWSRIPGFISLILNKLSLVDLFTFVVAAHAGWLTGGLFGVFGMLFARLFGPYEWWPYTIRSTISLFIAAMSVPIILSFTNGINLISFFIYEGFLYLVYYLLVILFFIEEIKVEIVLLPFVIFFDFFMNGYILKRFEKTFSELMFTGFSSGLPILVFSGVILFFVIIARNGERIAHFLEPLVGKLK